MKSGAELIADERRRQIEEEGWTDKHDDQHDMGGLANAAACYAATVPEIYRYHKRGRHQDHIFRSLWPWHEKWDKRDKHDRKRRLVIAGALIAAEIDRLQRQEKDDTKDS